MHDLPVIAVTPLAAVIVFSLGVAAGVLLSHFVIEPLTDWYVRRGRTWRGR